jgi:hypothetical protein
MTKWLEAIRTLEENPLNFKVIKDEHFGNE